MPKRPHRYPKIIYKNLNILILKPKEKLGMAKEHIPSDCYNNNENRTYNISFYSCIT